MHNLVFPIPRNREEKIVNKMLRIGYAEMSVCSSTLESNLRVIQDTMKRLTDDPELGALFPKQITASERFNDEVVWETEAGLIRRNDNAANIRSEQKIFFHSIPKIRWKRENEISDFAEFLKACEFLSAKASNIALELAHAYDAMQGHVDKPRSLYSAILEGTTVTRVLRYKKTGSARAHAHTHLDRSALTIHWWASHPGLKIVGFDEEHYRVDEAALDKVAIFPGMKFAGLFPEFGYGTLHGVRDQRTATLDESQDRYSLVSFVHAKLSPEAFILIRDNLARMEAYEIALHILSSTTNPPIFRGFVFCRISRNRRSKI
jgi:hypothetical protein